MVFPVVLKPSADRKKFQESSHAPGYAGRTVFCRPEKDETFWPPHLCAPRASAQMASSPLGVRQPRSCCWEPGACTLSAGAGVFISKVPGLACSATCGVWMEPWPGPLVEAA